MKHGTYGRHRTPEGVPSTAQTVAGLQRSPDGAFSIDGPIVTGPWDGPPQHEAQETHPLTDRPTEEIR